MKTKDLVKLIEKSGLRIEKKLIMEALRKSGEPTISILKDDSSEYIVLKMKIR